MGALADWFNNTPLPTKLKQVGTVFVFAVLVYFVIKYWKVIKYLGLGLGLMAALPFLADIIGGVIGVAGTVGAFLAKKFLDQSKGNKTKDEDKADADTFEKAIKDGTDVVEMDPGSDPKMTFTFESGWTVEMTQADFKDPDARASKFGEIGDRIDGTGLDGEDPLKGTSVEGE